jgi:glycosyltransferase involved in cell wall biosynthesis
MLHRLKGYMEHNHLVTVIIPVYNCERYLAEAIESVLSQTHRPIEVIVVDDGSTDNSAQIARKYGAVQYYFQPHGGIGNALNTGIYNARGNFFSFLDADDLWTDSKLTHQMTVFKNNPKIDIVFGHVEHFFSSGMDENIRRTLYCPDKSMSGYIKGAMLIKREAFFKVGQFATKWKLGDFVDWYLRAMEKGLTSFMLPYIVLRRRIHSANKVICERNYQTDYVRILKDALDRRRHKEVKGYKL